MIRKKIIKGYLNTRNDGPNLFITSTHSTPVCNWIKSESIFDDFLSNDIWNPTKVKITIERIKIRKGVDQ